jgi:hypothetical protein
VDEEDSLIIHDVLALDAADDARNGTVIMMTTAEPFQNERRFKRTNASAINLPLPLPSRVRFGVRRTRTENEPSLRPVPFRPSAYGGRARVVIESDDERADASCARGNLVRVLYCLYI